MMNPEFKRNLWLSFSTHNLIAMPVLLGLTFFAIAISGDLAVRIFNSLYGAAITLFVFIVWLWGARNANLSIVDELRDKTWDQQRMSALGPWTMTWGKLLGSTSFNWYGGAFCLAVAIAAALAGDHPYWGADLLSLAASGLMLHAGLIALNLHSARVELQLIRRGGLGWIAIIFSLIAFEAVSNVYSREHMVTWWGADVPGKLFLLYSVAVFAACAVFAAWRVVSNALQVRTLPWAWPLFAAMLTVYFAGLSEFADDNALFALSHAGLLVAGIMTYGALFSEPARLPDWNMLRLRQQKGDWRGWLQNLPLWPTTLLLAFGFALMASLADAWADGNAPSGAHWLLSARPLHVPLAFALMLLRDAAIVLFFSFSPKARRPAAAALLYLFVLDALLPFFFKVAGLDALSFFFHPFDGAYGAATAVLVMASHAVIALGLVAWRLQNPNGARTA